MSPINPPAQESGGVPPLRVSRAEATSQLRKRLMLGRNLVTRPINSPEELREAEANFQSWREYTYDLLRKLFTEESPADAFNLPARRFFGLGGDFAERPNDYKEDGQVYLRRLASRIERLALSDELGEIKGSTAIELHGSSTLVFLSYYTPEAPMALKLQESIQDAFGGAVRVFVATDPRSIRAGRQWMREVEQALRECAVQVILLSPQALTRPWLYFEAGAVWLTDRPVVPVVHSGLRVSQLEVPFSYRQGFSVASAADLRNCLFDVIATAAGEALPDYDFEALARKLAHIEQELAPSEDETALPIEAGPLGSLRNLSEERMELEEGLYGALLRLQTLRAAGRRAAGQKQQASVLQGLRKFISTPSSLSDAQVLDLRAETDAVISDLTDQMTSSPADSDLEIAILQAMRELHRRESIGPAIPTLDVPGLAAELHVEVPRLQSVLADLLAEGLAEPHYPTMGQGPMDGAVAITAEGMHAIRHR